MDHIAVQQSDSGHCPTRRQVSCRPVWSGPFHGPIVSDIDNSVSLNENKSNAKDTGTVAGCDCLRKGASIFKLFLGYAPGVGKTFSMLSEAVRRHSRGEDVVIGVVETHGRQAVSELTAMLDTVPRRKLEYRGATFAEMDVDAILTRKPKVVLVDELAHTNIEGSKHSKRYEDVLELLDAGIDVLSTMNIQHLESISPTVQGVTGIQVRETVPDWVLQRVNEVVMVDLTPEALQNRMRRGDIYPLERVGRALENFFKQGNLIALRELALRQVANAVDRNLESHRQLEQPDQAVAVRERIAVHQLKSCRSIPL